MRNGQWAQPAAALAALIILAGVGKASAAVLVQTETLVAVVAAAQTNPPSQGQTSFQSQTRFAPDQTASVQQAGANALVSTSALYRASGLTTLAGSSATREPNPNNVGEAFLLLDLAGTNAGSTAMDLYLDVSIAGLDFTSQNITRPGIGTPIDVTFSLTLDGVTNRILSFEASPYRPPITDGLLGSSLGVSCLSTEQQIGINTVRDYRCTGGSQTLSLYLGALAPGLGFQEQYSLVSQIYSNTRAPQDVAPSVDARFLLDGVRLSLRGVDVAAPGIPEPATWALMITGFGLAGGTLRRRRVAAG